ELTTRAGDVVRDINDVLVGTDSVVLRDRVVRQIVGTVGAFDSLLRRSQSRPGMRRPDDRSLLLGPPERVQSQGRPVPVRFAAGVIALGQSEQAEVTRAMRAEAGDFDVVAQQVGELRDLVILAREELQLVTGLAHTNILMR